MEQYRKSYKYITTKDNLKFTLDKYGVAIIENVLTVVECAFMTSGMWYFFEHISANIGLF